MIKLIKISGHIWLIILAWFAFSLVCDLEFKSSALAHDDPYHTRSGDSYYHKRLSVGAFLRAGRDQGSAGGIRFSGTTFSVQALTGEAPMLVRDATGRALSTSPPSCSSAGP